MTLSALGMRSWTSGALRNALRLGTPARDGAGLLVIVFLIGVVEYVFAYWNVAYGIGLALLLALSLAVFSAVAPISPGLVRCVDSLNLLPLYVLLTSSLPWFFLDQQLILPAVYYCIILLCLRHLRSRGSPLGSPATYGFRRENAGSGILLGLLVGIPTGTMEYFILVPAPEGPFLNVGNLARDILYMVVFVGFAEELLFRGILQQDLADLLGWKSALLLSSLVFGIMHLTWRSVPEVLFTVCAGLVLGYIYHRTRNLAGPIVLHGVNNVMLVSIVPYIGLLES